MQTCSCKSIFAVTLYGWYKWKKKSNLNCIASIGLKARFWTTGVIIIGTFITGFIFSNIHLYLPTYFPIEATYPYIDSFVMILSVIATILLAQKKIEAWHLWIIIDVVCVFLFFKKGVVFLALEYFVFWGMAINGLFNWEKQLNNG